jgi:hypothetical protein
MDGRIGTGPLRIDIPPQQLTPAAAGISQKPAWPDIQLVHPI